MKYDELMDKIEHTPGRYAPWQAALAAAAACSAFVFLLGGGPFEMLFAFAGAGLGGYVRRRMPPGKQGVGHPSHTDRTENQQQQHGQ